MDNAAGLLAGFLVLALSLAIYFIPTLASLSNGFAATEAPKRN